MFDFPISTGLKFSLAAAATSTLLAAPASAVVVVADDFANDGTAVTDADYYASSTSGAIEIGPNSVGLNSGGSGRQIHALFATQTLANTGDSLTATVTFTTPATVAATNEDFRWGLFDHLGRTSASQLGQNTSYSSGSPNPDFSGLPGFYSELDVESSDPASDLNIRRSDPSTSGRLLATSSGFTSLGSGPDIGYAIVANTSYTTSLIITRTAGNGLDITAEFLGNSFTVTDAAPASFDFGMLAFGSSSSAFGSNNNQGDPDNGIEITEVTVDFNPIPEPGSLALLGLGGLALFSRRRKA